MSDDGARRAPASVSGVSETSTSSRSGSALEHALEASSRAGVREQAAQRALGGGNVLYDPLGVFLAGERAVASVAGSIDETAETKRKRPVAVVAASAVRHRAIDDVILRECSSARDGVRQVVVIQPGFGTRPYRLALPDVTWFEVDAMEVLLLKRHLIRAAGGGEKSKALSAAPSFGGAGKAKTAAGAQETPFAHLATPSVRDVKLVGFDVKKEILAASRGGGGAGGVGAAAPGADAHKKQNASKSTTRLAAALEKAGFDTSKPCVFVIEDALTTLEPWEARFLMRSLPVCAPGSTLVVAGVPRRVKKWAERAAKAALASGSATVDPDALRLAEIASRWRCDLERSKPREKGWFLFPFKNRFVKNVSASLATHAVAYGAVADADVYRADAERVAEFKKKKRGFLGLPGAPGVFLFPVKPKTLVTPIAPVLGKVPVLNSVLKKLNVLDDDATSYARVAPRGPPATSGKFNALVLALVPRAREGGASKRFLQTEKKYARAHRRGVRGVIANCLNTAFETPLGRVAVVTGSVLLGHKYGDDLNREARKVAKRTRDAGRGALDAGRRFRDETLVPFAETTVGPFLNEHVAARLPGEVTFFGGEGGKGKGKAPKAKAKAKPPKAEPKAKKQ
jgi:O-methyltransferase involved in polyketide biosynthesis